MNTRISDAAVVLRSAAAVLDMWEGNPDETGYMGDFADACAILEILAQHADTPRPAKPEAVRLRDELRRRAEGCEEEGLGGTADLLRQAAASLEHSMIFARDYKTDDVAVLLDAAASVQPSPEQRPWATAQHCQNGRHDICLAAQRDDVVCPEDSCDIATGIRYNHLTGPVQPSSAGHGVDLEQFRVAVYCMQKYTGLLPRKYWDKGSKAFDAEAIRLMTVIDGAEVTRG